MNHFALFRKDMEKNLLCGAESPMSDEDFFQLLYSMDQEEYGIFIALDILYSLPAREEHEKVADFLRGLL